MAWGNNARESGREANLTHGTGTSKCGMHEAFMLS